LHAPLEDNLMRRFTLIAATIVAATVMVMNSASAPLGIGPARGAG
jgi:hypothetical protein